MSNGIGRHILITGPPGVGKTTLIKKVVQELQNKRIHCDGFYTEEKRENGVRVGFEVVTLRKSERYTLAEVENKHGAINGPNVGRYAVNVSSFESAVRSIFSERKSAEKTPAVLIIDEVGKMECFSSYFKKTVSKLFKNAENTLIVATVPVNSELPIVKEICRSPSSELFSVNTGNRNLLVDHLIQIITTMYSNATKS